MRDNGISRCIDIQGLAPKPRIRGIRAPDTRDEEPGPVPTIFPQPCAGWMRDNGMSRCIDIQGLAPKPCAGARPLHPASMTGLIATPAAELDALADFLPEAIQWLEPAARKKPNRRRRHVERFRTDDDGTCRA